MGVKYLFCGSPGSATLLPLPHWVYGFAVVVSELNQLRKHRYFNEDFFSFLLLLFFFLLITYYNYRTQTRSIYMNYLCEAAYVIYLVRLQLDRVITIIKISHTNNTAFFQNLFIIIILA